MTEVYKPISCTFYDRLEEAATLKKVVDLEYFDAAQRQTIKTKIKTLKIRDKVEYMVLDNDEEIRLDKIYALDGVVLNQTC